jgi:hypothetical protein
MATKSAVAGSFTEDAAEVSTPDSSTLPGDGKKTITPAERWVLIGEHVYAQAQRRGFVGGNPLQDLLDAEREIDAAYKTDFNCVFSLTSTAAITEQLKSLFAGYGFDQEDLERLLDGHRDGLENLAAMNRDLLDSAAGLVARQTRLLQDVANESAKTLQSFTQGKLRHEGVFRIAELSMQAFSNALTGLPRSSRSVPVPPDDRSGTTFLAALLHDTVESEFEGQSASQLVDAPVAALKGISDSLAEKLEEAFAFSTIGDMAANEHAEWARAVVLLADANLAARKVADSRITEVQNISQSQACLLREEFGIETVGDLGNHPLFNSARTIVMLAQAKG